MEGNSQVTNPVYELEACELNKLLPKFEDILKEPSKLSPYRSQDHKIVLKEGIVPVNVRSYRYPVYQKNEIEKLVQEMLQYSVIRYNTSSFSSSVVLVKKKNKT